MAAFGAGTIPALSFAALGLRRLLMTTLWRRRAFAMLVLGTGLWTIWTRATAPVSGAHQHQMMPGISDSVDGRKSTGGDVK